MSNENIRKVQIAFYIFKNASHVRFSILAYNYCREHKPLRPLFIPKSPASSIYTVHLVDMKCLLLRKKYMRLAPCRPQLPPNFNDKNYTFYDNSLGIVKLFAIMIRIRSRESS